MTTPAPTSPLQHTHQLLQHWLSRQRNWPQRLLDATHYCLFPGGKRLRPRLVYATAQTCGLTPAQVDPIALAIELIHTYSLVHDDLPAMDDDDLRRGKPSCHRAFDESTAILVGDLLLTHAFEALATCHHPASIRCQLLSVLASACGGQGLIGGQYFDLHATDTPCPPLTTVHHKKTGMLFEACAKLVLCLTPQLPLTHQQALTAFAHCFGRAYQLRDDLEDATQTQGAPLHSNVVHTLGHQGCHDLCLKLLSQARQTVHPMPQSDALLALATECAPPQITTTTTPTLDRPPLDEALS